MGGAGRLAGEASVGGAGRLAGEASVGWWWQDRVSTSNVDDGASGRVSREAEPQQAE